jgi:anthranilate phosphoribosyltransferase
LYGYLYQKTGTHFVILHSLDGYDEVSLTGPFKLIGNSKEQIVQPEEIGFNKLKQSDLTSGNSIEDSAKIFTKVLNNESTKAQKDVVIANSGLAIYCANPGITMEESFARAKESLESKRAQQAFKKLIELSSAN